MSDQSIGGSGASLRYGSVPQLLPAITMVAVTLATYAAGVELLQAIGIGLFAFSFAWYVSALGRELAIVQITALIATAQWLLGPALAYIFGLQTYKYQMYVPSNAYFSFVVPSVGFLILGLALAAPRVSLDRVRDRLLSGYRIPDKTIYLIFFSGFFADFAVRYAPASIGFAFFIMAQFKFIAIAYMCVLRVKWRWAAIFAAFVALAGTSLQTGMFHTLALWSALILTFVAYEFRLSFTPKATILLVLTLAVTQLQATKPVYREIIRDQPQMATLETFTDVFFDAETFDAINSGDEIIKMLNVRLNQGWIISAVMAYTPSVQPFANGATVLLAIRDSLLPRFLVEKRQVEVSSYFKKYTGLSVARHTSFGISVVGEAWVNFGVLGIMFMCLFGTFYGLVLRYAKWMSKKHPSYILWTPLFFLQAIKAETELVVVMNHMVKSIIVVYLIYFLSYRFFRIRI